MAVTKLSNSTFTGLNKYDSLLAGNSAFVPSDFESIATITGSGNPASITFSSIPSTYTHLQIRTVARDTDGSAGTAYSTTMRINGLSTSIYAFHQLVGNNSSASASANINQTGIDIGRTSVDAGATSNTFGVSVIDILDYKDTTKFKTIRSLSGADGNSASTGFGIQLQSGLWRSTSAITSITINAAITSFNSNSHFALYGIKA